MRAVFLPRTLEELWQIPDNEPEAAIYAGGTDLLVKMATGQVDPPSLVCLERIDALRMVEEEDDAVFIGAAVTHSRLLENAVIRRHFPILAQALSVLGSPPIRHMGTIGGNIVTASPAGDSLPALYVLSAELEISSKEQSRRVALKDFIQGPGSVDLGNGEILTGIRVRKQPEWNIHHFEKVGRRKAQACSVASLAALVKVSRTGKIERVRPAWGSVGPTVVTSPEVENALIGRDLTLETMRSVAPLVQEAVSPIDDARATAQYRRIVAGALLLRLSQYAGNPEAESASVDVPYNGEF